MVAPKAPLTPLPWPRGFSRLQDEGDAFGSDAGALAVAALAAALVVLSAVVLVPALLVAAAVGLRPCTIEARSRRGLLRARRRGLRESARALDQLAAALCAGSDPAALFPDLEVRGRVFGE